MNVVFTNLHNFKVIANNVNSNWKGNWLKAVNLYVCKIQSSSYNQSSIVNGKILSKTE